MANIDEELQIILNAERGDEVRSAIAAAIQKISADREYAPQTLNIGNAENHRTLTGGPWDKVVVDIDGSGGATFDLDYYGTIDANGYYDLWNTGWAERFPGHGWNGFHVDIPQHNAQLTVKEITENGVYDPLAEGYDGYSKIVVSVPNAAGSGDMLTVSFYNGNLFLSSTQVAYGGQAIYTGETPVGDTPFVGWNPDPSKVLSNMRCQAVFAGSLGGTISDDWVTIARNCQAGLAQSKYPIGSTKELYYTMYGNPNLTYKTEMVLVNYNDQTFKSTKSKVPKTFWYSRYMLPAVAYGPTYGLDQNEGLVLVSPTGSPVEQGLWNWIKRPDANYYGFFPSTDTEVVSGRKYAIHGVPTVGVSNDLYQLLSPVDRYINPAKATWSGSGTTLNYTTERYPAVPTDSKIFALTETEFAKFKTLFQGLAKQMVNNVEVSLWNTLALNQSTGEVTITSNPTYQYDVTPEIKFEQDKGRWYFNSSTGEAEEWGKDFAVNVKDALTAVGNTGHAHARISDAIINVSGQLFRFGFCI